MSTPPTPPKKPTGFNLITVVSISLTTFMTGLFVGSTFMPSTASAPPPSPAANLPSDHPPLDPKAGIVKAPPLKPEQTPAAPTGAAASTSSHEEHGAGFDQNFDDPAIRATIDKSNDYKVLVRIGNEQFDARHPKLAILAYEKALKIHPFDADVQTDLGVMYRVTHRHDDAVNAFRKAVEMDPKHTQSRFNLGLVLLEDEGDKAGAIQAWEDYLKVDPNGPKSQEVRGMLAKLKPAG